MGTTVIIALAFWLSASYVEYKIIKGIPALKPIFDNQVLGIVLSIVIGSTVAYILGIPNGIGAALGQLLGLATNEFTYKFFDTSNKVWYKSKNTKNQAQAFYSQNKKLVNEAVNTVRLGFKALVAIFMVFMFIIGLPFRAAEWVKKIQVKYSKPTTV